MFYGLNTNLSTKYAPGYLRWTDIACCLCHKASPSRSCTKNDSPLTIIKRIFLGIRDRIEDPFIKLGS